MWIVRVPVRPTPGASAEAREDYASVEAPNPSIARRIASPIVRWDPGRLEIKPCEEPNAWVTVEDRVRYDALTRLSRSLLNEQDRRFIAAVARKKPLVA